MFARCRVVVVAAAVGLLASPSSAGQSALASGVLLYGFEPFDVFDVNPTKALVAHLAQSHPERRDAVLSITPEDALGELYSLMATRPRLIIGFGVRGDVAAFEVNTAARNWLAMRTESTPRPYYGAIDPGLPATIALPTVWHGTVLEKLRALDVTHTVSPDAGTHACNLTFFQSMAHAAPGTRVLFVHVAPDVMTRPELLAGIEQLVSLLSPSAAGTNPAPVHRPQPLR